MLSTRWPSDVADKWWFDCLSRGYIDLGWHWDKPIPCSVVFDSFYEHASKAGARTRSDQTTLGMRLNRLVPGLEKRKTQFDIPVDQFQSRLELKGRLSGYTFPSLAECRQYFMKATGVSGDWGDDD